MTLSKENISTFSHPEVPPELLKRMVTIHTIAICGARIHYWGQWKMIKDSNPFLYPSETAIYAAMENSAKDATGAHAQTKCPESIFVEIAVLESGKPLTPESRPYRTVYFMPSPLPQV
jgi:hypothetical protein